MNSSRANESGFTLIEIMVVVFILGLLVVRVVPNVMSYFGSGQYERAKSDVAAYVEAVHLFRLDNGRLPTASEGLSVLVPPPPANLPRFRDGGYLGKSFVKRDPWDNPYEYRRDGSTFAVVSFGADGRPGGRGNDADIDSRFL